MDEEEMEESPSPPPSPMAGEEAAIPVFVCFEVDLEYEFDAPKYFDLGREELPAEISVAESWFVTACSYPPSPLLARIYSGIYVQKESTDPDLQNLECSNDLSAHPDAAVSVFSGIESNPSGSLIHNSGVQYLSTIDKKSTAKKHLSKSSTLMKPTASHLAKQAQPLHAKGASRCKKQIEVKPGRSVEELNDYAHQAAKRQRLERGLFCKVVGMKQPVDLFHKIPDKKNGTADMNIQSARMKITIPREPELLTSKRALVSRVQQPSNAKSLLEGVPSVSTSCFKARPLNRKILQAPSLPLPQRSSPRLPKFKEFNFKTHERAIQHCANAESSEIAPSNVPSVHCDAKVVHGIQCHSSAYQIMQNDGKSAEQCNAVPLKFKAQRLNKKILSRKGDIGASRCIKREVTQPKFATTKWSQQAPLAELFNKLTLSSDLKITTLSKFPLSSQVDTKDLKENLTSGRQH